MGVTKIATLAALLALACGAAETAPAADAPAPEALAFRVEAARADEVQGVLDRWSAATCLDLRVSADGTHTVTYTNRGFADADRYGQVTGEWAAATIRIRTEDMVSTSKGMINQVQADDQRLALTHEIGHLLAKSNAHADHGILSDDWFRSAEDVIDADLLAVVCFKRECGCVNPE